jgi:excisionase family DNA binding protein
VGEDRTGQPNLTNQRVTVSEAAEQLGITVEAVRMRIKRGTLRSERQAGRVFVLLGQDQPTDQPTDRPDEPNALISQMQGRIDSLERQLEEAAERDRENRRIIAALTSRIPAIEAPQEAREAPETVEEQQGRGQPHSDRVESPAAVHRSTGRSLWRRIFGG